MNELSNIDNTLYAFSELFPPQQPETKFDKILDLIKSLSSGTLVGTVGQVLTTTIKTCGIVSTEKQRVQAVKYVKDAYEVKCRAEVEMQRLNVESEKNSVLTLYIEKSFQNEIDEIQKKHIYDMQGLKDNKDVALYEIDQYARVQLEGIDKKYATIIRANEDVCWLYRRYLDYMRKCNESPAHLIAKYSEAYMNIVQNSVFDRSIKMSDVQIGLDQILKLLQFLSSTNNYFLPFETFIEQRKQMEVI